MQQSQGIQSIRTCTIAGHKQKPVLQICCFEFCNQTSRWACEECMKNSLHMHSRDKQISLKDQQEFIKYLQQKLKTREESEYSLFNKIDKIILNLKDMQTEINGLIKFLNNGIAQKKSNNEKQLIKEFKDKIQKDYYQFSTQQIDEIIRISSTLTEINQYQKFDELILTCLQKFKDFQKKDQYFKDNEQKIIPRLLSPIKNQDTERQNNNFATQKYQNQPTQIYRSSSNVRPVQSNNICQNDQLKIQRPVQVDQITPFSQSQDQYISPKYNIINNQHQKIKITEAEGNNSQLSSKEQVDQKQNFFFKNIPNTLKKG